MVSLSITMSFLLAILTPAQTANDFNVCRLANGFDGVHATVRGLVRDVDETAALVKSLNRTSRSRPYKRVEESIASVRSHVKAMFNALSDILIALDAAPDTRAKKDATALAAADWNAVDLIADYAGAVLLNEREENLVSMNTGSQWLTFGVNKNSPQVAGDNYARDQLEGKMNEPREALRLLQVPEDRYESACNFAPRRRQARR